MKRNSIRLFLMPVRVSFMYSEKKLINILQGLSKLVKNNRKKILTYLHLEFILLND